MATFGSLQLRCISGVDGHYVSSSASLVSILGYSHLLENHFLSCMGSDVTKVSFQFVVAVILNPETTTQKRIWAPKLSASIIWFEEQPTCLGVAEGEGIGTRGMVWCFVESPESGSSSCSSAADSATANSGNLSACHKSTVPECSLWACQNCSTCLHQVLP